MELNFSFLQKTFLLALHGIPTALFITISSLLLATLPAYFLALARLYKTKFFSKFATIYISFIRGIPMVVQILIIYSLLPSLLNSIFKFFGNSASVFSMNPLVYAVTVFTLVTIASLSEVIRAAIMTVDKGQLDAAQALGMKPLQSFKLIIIPQAIQEAIPNLSTLTVSLFKETSLCFLMTVKDITAIAKIEASYGYNYIESYIAIFIIYLIVCSLIQLFFYICEVISKIYR